MMKKRAIQFQDTQIQHHNDNKNNIDIAPTYIIKTAIAKNSAPSNINKTVVNKKIKIKKKTD